MPVFHEQLRLRQQDMAGRGTDIKLDDKSKELGGLKIIGTERHESRRIDNQLRGRFPDVGSTRNPKFYISLEDDLMDCSDLKN